MEVAWEYTSPAMIVVFSGNGIDVASQGDGQFDDELHRGVMVLGTMKAV